MAILEPLHAAQKAKADKEAADAAEAARQAEEASQRATIVKSVTGDNQVVSSAPAPNLVAGVLGYSLPYGNCVDEPGVNNPGWGNPIQWTILSYDPWPGASALFYYNHVAIVSGIYSDGSLEVRQQNSPGAPHHVPRSQIRGFR